MSTFKKSQVVMLPTKEKANKGDIIGNDKGFTVADISYSLTELSLIQAKVYKLYLLSDEEIKEGDWIYRRKDGYETIQKATLPLNLTSVNKKLIATTDKLIVGDDKGKSLLGTDLNNYLPQPSDSFIQKYVEEYNKGNVIEEVMVEYNDVFISNQGLDYNETVTCKIVKIEGDDVYGEYISSLNVDEDDIDLEIPFSLSSLIKEGNQIGLKVNPKDNTITIRKVKDSWDREEIIKLINKISEEVDFESATQKTIDKWIEENI